MCVMYFTNKMEHFSFKSRSGVRVVKLSFKED